ncbi:MAG: hypothetical protein J6P74_02335 [Paludibacteraceae bacterium]|nr:hypothetical protein [Paludibacteraceae bacterium]
MSQHLKSDVIHRLHSTIAESSQISASCGVSFCARGTRYLDLTDAIVYYRGRVNTLKEARHYGKNLILRPSRRFKGKHVLYTCHIPKSWSAACVANRALIKLAQSRAHAIERDPVARAEWEPLYLEHKANPAPHPKPYSSIYHFIYCTLYQSLRAEYLAARSVLIARASRLAQSIRPCSKDKCSVRAISMSASDSLPASHPISSIAPACHAGIALVRRANNSVGISCISCASLCTGSAGRIVSARSRPLIRLPIAA